MPISKVFKKLSLLLLITRFVCVGVDGFALALPVEDQLPVAIEETQVSEADDESCDDVECDEVLFPFAIPPVPTLARYQHPYHACLSLKPSHLDALERPPRFAI